MGKFTELDWVGCILCNKFFSAVVGFLDFSENEKGIQ